MIKIGFGGGCHWCTEAVFQSLSGVKRVDQGWIAAEPPFEAFSEAVIVHFDPTRIDLAALIEIHLRTHASQSAHRFRSKYRSAVYVFGPAQMQDAQAVMDRLCEDFDPPVVTRLLRFMDFRASAPRFQNYYRKGPDRPFCRAYIDPKLTLLRQQFGRHMRPSEDG